MRRRLEVGGWEEEGGLKLGHSAERQPRGMASSCIIVGAQDLPIARACRESSGGYMAWDIRGHARFGLDLLMALVWKLPSRGRLPKIREAVIYHTRDQFYSCG
jgi:hypothetical protein